MVSVKESRAETAESSQENIIGDESEVPVYVVTFAKSGRMREERKIIFQTQFK